MPPENPTMRKEKRPFISRQCGTSLAQAEDPPSFGHHQVWGQALAVGMGYSIQTRSR
jgi:hypothetical protein